LEHGTWKYYYSDGAIKEQSDFFLGRLNGPVKRFYKNGQLETEGYFDWDRPDSLLQSFFPSGNPKEKGYYKEGLKMGEWKYWYPDSILNMVEFVHKEDSVKLISYFLSNGEAAVVDGSGFMETYYTDGERKSKEAYTKGWMTGESTTWYPDAQKRTKGYYDQSKKDSTWLYYFSNGNLW
jgi:antitoxin component YwqK of YwqJK toxin-antitoxin module